MKEGKSVLMEFKRLSNGFHRISNNSADFRDIDLTTVQFMMLMYLLNNKDRDIFQRDIEAMFKIRRSTVTNLIQSVEKKGYIRRESVKSDARLKRICLTEKAKEVGNKMFAEMHRIESIMKKGINDDKLTAFFEVIDLMTKNLEGK